ncbi:hypothetical protein Dimus_024857 [Dionaea muscipula]
MNGMGWGSFLSLPDKFYPMVVRHFYCNHTWTNGHHGIELHSYFLGHRLKITRPLLAHWIGVDLCDNKTFCERIFENTPILLEEKLDEACGGPLNQFAISQSKVLEKINARAAQVDVNPDNVNEVVDELVDDAGGNVNALRRAFSSSMTPQVFADYHREIMEGIQALQTFGNAHTTQMCGIATTQSLHERRISGLERDMRSIRSTTY